MSFQYEVPTDWTEAGRLLAQPGSVAKMGGCDVLLIEPFEFSGRLAGNVHLLLKHEVHLDQVSDPAAGSYYIEWLTDALAREAWKLFQQVEALGGIAAAQTFIESSIAASRKASEAAVASRRRTLVGVNNYPDLNETSNGRTKNW